MKKNFINRLTEFLDSECSDYDLSYDFEWIEDCGYCEVAIKRDDHHQRVKYVNFKYIESSDDLEVEFGEDCFYKTREFDSSVKLFWMLISPSLFPDA